jgi:transcription termination factor Rho
MTITTGESDRSALESKDRQELATIAKAMGANPPARARKDELIDLILDLAENGGAGAPEEKSDGDAMSEQTTEDEATEAKAEPEAESDGAEKAKEKAADEKAEKSEREPRSNGSGRDRDQQQRGGQRNQGQRGGGGGDDDEAEPGNRKRRRRGRSGPRERDDQPQQQWDGEPVEVEGMLDLRDEGYGFLRVNGALPSRDDVYVSVKQVRQFGMRKGDRVTGASRPANRNEKNPALLRIDTVNGMDPEKAKARPRFEDLTPLFPDERLRLEDPNDPGNMTARIIDLLAPIGKGQRGMIVSPSKSGKTTIMKTIARSIETNNPEVKLLVVLVDERPEEVTDMRRWVKGEVVASTFDRPADEHTAVAELAIDRAKRMVEMGEDVVIILDGITRLARAYNLAAPATGRIMSGGVDSGALYPPKRFFGAARNLEEGGSLTILATALIETGSKMDEVIFEEFKGTGNMELRLDRKLAERRIYPSIDVDASSTRHEELLFERKQLQQVWKLRRVLSGLADGGGGGTGAGLELLIDRLKTFKNNDEFLAEVAKGPSIAG